MSELQRLFDNWNPELRDRILKELHSDPIYKRNYYLSIEQYRRTVVEILKKLVALKLFSIYDYQNDPLKFLTFLRTIGHVDYSTSIKAGVHFTLCGGSILALGTKKHYKILDKMDTLELFGSLAMTELGHGSNVAEIETTATYDAKEQVFVINSPTETSQKFWIGGAAEDAHITVALAQLHIDGKNQGVHAFIVQLRDQNGKIMSGINIKDNGPKMGINGVDNGRIWFRNVKIPKDNLLDKFCTIDKDGKYSSPIKNPVVRFATMIGGLVSGRILIAAAGVDGAKIALANAILYSVQRKQFGDVPGKEVPIMSYLSHQRRLIPAVATTYAIEAALNEATLTYNTRSPDTMKKVHLLAAGAKAFATWHRTETASVCRQCVGGQGFSAYNKIAEVITDREIDTTFEGDNTVLTQQITKSSLAVYASRLKVGVPLSPVFVPKFDLDSFAWYQAAFKRRDYDKLRTLAIGIQALRGKGFSESEAYNQMQDLGLKSAWATMERMVLRYFIQLVEQKSMSDKTKSLLTQTVKLYALDRIERDIGYFLSEGLISKEEVMQVRDKLNSICSQLYKSGDLLTLVEGFGVPQISLGPIAGNYVKFYAHL